MNDLIKIFENLNVNSVRIFAKKIQKLKQKMSKFQRNIFIVITIILLFFQI